jgi:hypothetical protein
MATPVNLFGVVRKIPANKERRWGSEVRSVLIDLSTWANGLGKLSGSAPLIGFGSTDSTLAAAATLTPASIVHRVQGSGGAVTLNGTTAIANGTLTGQLLVLIGLSDTNTVTIQHGSNVRLNGNVVLALDDVLWLRWDGTDWLELSRNN